jgi:hypothetical protein
MAAGTATRRSSSDCRARFVRVIQRGFE